jgi:hypothetical protein
LAKDKARNRKWRRSRCFKKAVSKGRSHAPMVSLYDRRSMLRLCNALTENGAFQLKQFAAASAAL